MPAKYEEFRGLLRGAICNRTQAQFANDSHLSAEHLNRMLNAEEIHRPTKNTLRKIAAAAKNGITLQDLTDALDMGDGTKGHPSEQRTKQAMKDFAPEFDFEKEAAKAMDALCAAIEKQGYPVSAPSVADHVDMLVESARKSADCLPISYELGVERGNFGTACPDAGCYVTVYLSMAKGMETAESELMVYFDKDNVVNLNNGNDKKPCIVHMASCSIEAIMDQHGMPGGAKDYAESLLQKEHGDGDGAYDDDDVFARACTLPYYLDFAQTKHFRESYAVQGETKEERFINAMLGTEFRWSETIDGTGFEIDGIPPRLAKFLSQHARYVLANYEQDVEKCSEMEDALREKGKADDPEGIAAYLDGMEYRDEKYYSDEGWPAAVAEVMRAETGFPFHYHAPAKNLDEFPGLSEKGCIIVDVEGQYKWDIQREALLAAICRYAKQLGVKRFGDILFTGVHVDFRKPRTYIIKEKEEKDEPSVEEPEQEAPGMSVEFDPERGPWPDATGLYNVELKDGRQVQLVYVKNKTVRNPDGIWVKAHKEWSHMIARYCPDPRPKPEDEES